MDEEQKLGAEGGGGGGKEGAEGVDEFYRRRLDRSPEKKEFYQLPETDRRLICDLRSAMHSVYEKFSKLRDQVSEREADKTTEPGMMPDLKLDDLVDMYGDPAVNEELRQRLSRSSKGDPKATHARLMMHGQADDFSREKKKRHRSLELEDFEISLKKEKHKRRNLNRRQGSGRADNHSATESDDEVAARRTSPDADKTFRSARDSAASLSNFPSQGFFPPFYPWAPTSMTAPGGQQQGFFPPPGAPGYMAPPFVYPFGVIGPMPYVYPPASNLGPGGIQLDHEVPVRDTSGNVKQPTAEQEMTQVKETSVSNFVSQASPNADAGHDLIMSFAQQSMPSPSRLKSADEVDGANKNADILASSARIHEHCPVCAEAHALGLSSRRDFDSSVFSRKPTVIYVPESSESKRYLVRKTARHFGRNLTGTESMESRQLHTTTSIRRVDTSRILDKPLRGSISQKLDKQISVLFEELERSKDLNIQLQDELIAAEQELDSMRFILQNKDAEIRSQATGKLAVMVQDIYRAQKERDVAMMNRINRANAERDEALLQLKRLQQKFFKSTIKSDHSSAEEMKLNEILTSLQNINPTDNIDERGTEIIEVIKRVKEQRWQTAAEEMRAILEERDMALAKCKDLEAELSQMRVKIHDEETCRQQRQVIQGKLFATEHERNVAVDKISKLEEEMLSLKVYYNLHGSLSQEVSLYQQFSQTLDEVERQLRAKEEEMDVLRADREQLLNQLKASTDEKKRLMEELAKAHEAHVAECSKNEKLQRLVSVLRRKINGLGIKADEPE